MCEIQSQNFIELSGISDISAIFSIFLRFFGQPISFQGPPIIDILVEKTEILFLDMDM